MESVTVKQDVLARKLADQVPSAGLFDRMRIDELSDAGLIDALIASERLVRFAQGLQTRVLGVLAAQRAQEGSLVAGAVESEVTAALR